MKKRFITLALAAAIILETFPAQGIVAYADTMEETQAPAQIVEMTEMPEQKIELPLEIVEEKKIEEAPLAEEKKEAPRIVEEIPRVIEEPTVEEPVIEEPVVEEPVKVQPEQITFTIVIANILQPNGTSKDYTRTSTLKQGSTQSKAFKWFDNKITTKSFSYKGTKYTYTGRFVDANGREVSFPVKMDPSLYYEDVTIVLYPVYDIIEAKHLSAQYIDNISTASSSWYNVDEFSSYRHTFKLPESQPHYSFIEWRSEDGTAYAPGQSWSATKSILDPIADGGTLTVSFRTFWQPSVTVNYYVDGTLVNSAESFESVNVGSYIPQTEDKVRFIGWYDAAGNQVSDTTFIAPAITSERSDRYIENVYARFVTDYTVEHKLEGLDGTYVTVLTETVNDAVIGTTATAQAQSFDGFTFDGNVDSREVRKGLVLTVKYTRNSYNVTYSYMGSLIPEGAEDLLPQAKSYRFEESIAAEAAPSIDGYTFSGWDLNEETMPSHDITVTGSWDYADDTLSYDANGGKGTTDATLGKTFHEVTVSENSFRRGGYNFKGWNTMADGSGTAYAAGDIFTLTVDTDILYAQWEAIPVEIPADPTIPQVPVRTVPTTPVTPETEPAVENINEEIVPLAPVAEEEIEEMAMPLAVRPVWALLNLISAICTGLISLAMIAGYFFLGDKEEDEENNNDRHLFTRVLSLVPAAAAIVMFILTENMNNRMVLTDKWTIWMLTILLTNIVAAFAARKDDEKIAENDN
ncbi:MAG: InlB B-repeat-containing protein [Oscillospiraceae bacterium]|nr:InlB B-repeat-containing protein [Oscillospiraceae bacterium]